MKKFFLITLLLSSFLHAKINTIVSIAPQKLFVKKIGGDRVNIKIMVQAGNSPHTYEPKPSQMKDIAQANVYFSIGVEFEKIWLPKFLNQNKELEVFPIDKNIKKLTMEGHHHKPEHETDHKSHHENENPHIWLSPKNVKVISQNIYEYLVKIDSKNRSYYKENLENFLKEIDKLDLEIKKTLSEVKHGTKFMVFHPSWGYFANDYNLQEIAIEVSGKNPTPKNLIYIIKEAKEEGIKAIFVQPEFSNKIAKTLANELNIPIIKISPLTSNWEESLLKLAKAIK